jgi:anti-sigma regulatory factor (Ser/Thr protein kinase)
MGQLRKRPVAKRMKVDKECELEPSETGRFHEMGVEPERRERESVAQHESAPWEVVSARPNWVELSVPCRIDRAEDVLDFLMRLIADSPEDVQNSLGRALRELLLNAIEWGGKNDPRRKVRISFVRGYRMLLFCIADPGPGFSFKDLPHAALSNPDGKPIEHLRVRDRMGMRPGGYGLLLVKALVDELIFNQAHNEVMVVKYLGGC